MHSIDYHACIVEFSSVLIISAFTRRLGVVASTCNLLPTSTCSIASPNLAASQHVHVLVYLRIANIVS